MISRFSLLLIILLTSACGGGEATPEEISAHENERKSIPSIPPANQSI
jgi:hypothetical protein